MAPGVVGSLNIGQFFRQRFFAFAGPFVIEVVMLTTESNAGPIRTFRHWVDGANDGRRADKFEVLVESAIDAKILFLKYNIFFILKITLSVYLKRV